MDFEKFRIDNDNIITLSIYWFINSLVYIVYIVYSFVNILVKVIEKMNFHSTDVNHKHGIFGKFNEIEMWN